MNEQPFRTVTNLRKSGQLQEAWNIGFAALETSPQDAYLKGALFWVCYEFIKQQQEKIAYRAASSNNHRPSDFEFEQLESLLQTIVNLDIPTGGLEYKMLLVQFKKNLEWFPTLVHLVLRHQDALFDHETKQPFQADKGEVPSLMLSSVRQVASAWLRAQEAWQIDLNAVLSLIDLTRTQVADSKNIIWLDYDQAKCFVVSGQYERARELILPILRKKQNESWAWGALAATYQKQDKTLAMKFFAKGIISAHEPSFSLRLLKAIVPFLLTENKQREASMCLKTAINVYQANGWKVKQDLDQLSTQPWYDSSVDESQLTPFLKSICHDALEHLQGPIEKVVGIVENLHKSGKGFQVFVNRSISLSVRMGVHKGQGKPIAGDYVELCVSGSDGEKQVLACCSCQPIEIADVSNVEGNLKIAPKGFGFVEDTFVPPFVIGEIESGTRVNALRIMSWDKSKGRNSWKAIRLSVGEV